MSFSAMVDRTEAGPLIPEDAANEIIKESTEKSYVLSAFKRRQMSRKQQRIPIFDRKPIAYFVNGDTGLKQTSDVRWDNIFLNAEELAVIVPVPDLLVEDTAFDIWGQLRPEITEAIGAKIDEAVFFGVDRPTLWPTGLLQGATAAGQVITAGAVAGEDVFSDMNRVMVKLEEDGYDPMSWFGRIQMKGILRNQRDANKGFLYPAAGPANVGGQTAGWKGEVWNTPLFVSKMGFPEFAAGPTNASAFLLDTDNLICAVRDDINMKVFTEGVISDDTGKVILNLMQQDAKALRVTFRVAWAMANPVTRLQPDRAQRYPAAVLLQGTAA
jgi:HK97 family phage major capsid protein